MRTCHWCPNKDNLKAGWCWGDCKKEKSHSTLICKICYSKLSNADTNVITDWEKLTFSYRPKEKPFNPDGMYSDIVHYYMDKKHYSQTSANEIARNRVKAEMIRRGLVPA